MYQDLRFSALRNGILRTIYGGPGFTYQTVDGKPAEFRHIRREVKPVVTRNLLAMLDANLLAARDGKLVMLPGGLDHMDSWAMQRPPRPVTYEFTANP